MKVLITGASGQLARSVLENQGGYEFIPFTRKELDVQNKKLVESIVSRLKPEIVFHFASMTRGDECAKNPEKAYKINVIGTKNIVDACKKNNCALLFISTNEVFDGLEKKFYTESDIPNPKTIVGHTKYEAEKYIQGKLKKYYIVRTAWLYSKWSSNFIHAILKKASYNSKIELVVDEISTPTYTKDLALALMKLISKKKYGTYHIVNAGKASRYEFGKKTFYYRNLEKIKLESINLDVYDRISKPPLYTPLRSVKLASLGIKMSKWEDALKRFIETEI